MRHRLVICCLLFASLTVNKMTAQTSTGNTAAFGYTDKGDSILFYFGDQANIIVSGVKIDLNKRRSEIKQVNLAGDFNKWSPNNSQYELVKMNDRMYGITISKKILGNKGETRQFKYVLNHTYWIEPPTTAINKFKGKDGNTNLTVKL